MKGKTIRLFTMLCFALILTVSFAMAIETKITVVDNDALQTNAAQLQFKEAIYRANTTAVKSSADLSQQLQTLQNTMVRQGAKFKDAEMEKQVAERNKTIADKLARHKRELAIDQEKAQYVARRGKDSRVNAASMQNMAADEFEPDNSHNQGERLVPGFIAQKHNIFPANDVDFFYFEGDAGDIIEIITKTPFPFWEDKYGNVIPPSEADLDPFITLYLPDRSILETDDDSGPGWDSYMNIELPVSGTYYISIESSPVWAANPTVGDYEIGFNKILPDEFEPDNVMADANPISDGGVAKDHTIMGVGDVDWYVFMVNKPFTALKAAVVNVPSAKNWWDNSSETFKGDLDPKIELYSAAGDFLYANDDADYPADPELGYFDAELIIPSILPPGMYFLKVLASDKNPDFGTKVGSYELSLNLVEPDEFEPDNTPALANEIMPGETATGHTITSVIDGDMFKFVANAGEFVDIIVKTEDPCKDLDPGVALFADGSLGLGSWYPGLDWLHSSMDDGDGLDARIIWGPLPYTGTYYIEVGADPNTWYAWWERAGSYELTLETFGYEVPPFSPETARELDFNFCGKLYDVISRTGALMPPGSIVSTIPIWYKFEGIKDIKVAAKVTTPVQTRNSCGTINSDWMDDLNPQVWIIADDKSTILAHNKNIDPNNNWDDALAILDLPYTGTFYIKVDAEIVPFEPFFSKFEPRDSYGHYCLEFVHAPTITAIESDRNVGPAPLPVKFFSKCTKWEDPCTEEWIWDAMVGYRGGMGAPMIGEKPSFCYWVRGSHDVSKKACNSAGCATDFQEDFIQVYGPSGYAPMAFVRGSEAHVKENWDNAVDGDTYWWTGVATVKGEEPWAIFKFADGKIGKKINKVRILVDAGVDEEERWVKKFRVETSAGEPILGSTMLMHAGWSEFVIDPAVVADSIMLIVEEPTDGWRQITEFEVYEDIILASEALSTIEVTSPHMANGLDAALVILTLKDADGNPITVYDERDVAFYLEDCSTGNFSAVDAKCKSKGVFKVELTMSTPGTYEVIAVAHGAVVRNDANVSFFGHAGAKGPLVFIQGSETAKGEGWEKAVDGIREGWGGTVTARGNPTYAIFKFDSPVAMPFNKIGLATDNGFDDDAYEDRQVKEFEILKSDDMVEWTSVLLARNHTGEMKRYNLDKVHFAKYIQIILHQPDWTDGGWKQIVELEVLFDSKDGFQFAKEGADISAIPTAYGISQNYPNPFNPTTYIQFQLPQSGQVSLRVFNMLGQVVATLVDGQMEAGYHSARWDATDVPSGIYFYRIEAGTFNQSARMILLK